MKRRVTITLEPRLLKALDRAPGTNRSEKIERLLAEALALKSHRRWVAELKTFYQSDAAKAEREEDLAWQKMSEEAFFRDD
jgi:metal-responsive CopG/Arc/MetJ family transcriptional regulator